MYNEDSASIHHVPGRNPYYHVPGRNPYFLQANGRHWLRWQLEWAYKKKIFTRKVIVKVVGTSQTFVQYYVYDECSYMSKGKQSKRQEFNLPKPDSDSYLDVGRNEEYDGDQFEDEWMYEHAASK